MRDVTNAKDQLHWLKTIINSTWSAIAAEAVAKKNRIVLLLELMLVAALSLL